MGFRFITALQCMYMACTALETSLEACELRPAGFKPEARAAPGRAAPMASLRLGAPLPAQLARQTRLAALVAAPPGAPPAWRQAVEPLPRRLKALPGGGAKESESPDAAKGLAGRAFGRFLTGFVAPKEAGKHHWRVRTCPEELLSSEALSRGVQGAAFRRYLQRLRASHGVLNQGQNLLRLPYDAPKVCLHHGFMGVKSRLDAHCMGPLAQMTSEDAYFMPLS